MAKAKFPEYDYHRYADFFPMMVGEEFIGLVDSIKTNGLLDAIILHEGKILDGRNRYEGCRQSETKPVFKKWDGECGNPLSFVVAKNGPRRHMTPSQYAMVGARVREELAAEAEERRLANLKKGDSVPDGTTLSPPLGKTADLASAVIGGAASPNSIKKASKVIDQGTETLIAAVDTGEISVNEAAKIADLPEDKQNAAVKAKASGKKTAKKKPIAGDAYEHLIKLIGKALRYTDELAGVVGKDKNHFAVNKCLDNAVQAVHAWRKDAKKK